MLSVYESEVSALKQALSAEQAKRLEKARENAALHEKLKLAERRAAGPDLSQTQMMQQEIQQCQQTQGSSDSRKRRTPSISVFKSSSNTSVCAKPPSLDFLC